MDIPRRGKAKPRGRYHHGDLANALVEAVTRAVEDGAGAESLKLSEAARRVGVDPSAVYRHFQDRAALLEAVARRGFARMSSEMTRTVKDGMSAAQRLRVLGAAYVKFAEQHPALFRLMFGPYGAGRKGTRFTMAGPGGGAESPFDLLVQGLADYAAEGRLAVPSRRAALSAWAIVHGLASLIVDGAWHPSDARALKAGIDDAIQAMLRGVSR